MKADEDSAHVPIPPPLLLLICILCGVGLQYWFPMQFDYVPFRWFVGAILIAISIGTIIYCAWMFISAHTAIEPWKTTSQILVTGPYRWSRNPIYLCFVFIGIGIAMILNNLWIILMMVPLIGLINKIVIQREEKYLESKFTNEYLDYKNKVRRWI